MLVSMIRSIILYFTLILAIRLMGKRQIGQLEPSEFVVAMLLADLASVPMQDLGIPLLAGVIPILTILAIEVLLSVLSYRFLFIRRILCGTPIVLMENGRILEHNMKLTRVTTDELIEQLRQENLFDLSAVKCAILETNGQISAFTDSQAEPVSRGDLKLPSVERSLPITLISDGHLLKENLKESIYNEAMLLQTLKEHQLSIQDVFLLTVDASENLYISRKSIKP